MTDRTRKNSRGRVARAAALASVPVAAVTGMVLAGGPASAGSGSGTFAGSRGGCSVQISIGNSSATATPGAGCQAGRYWLSSWAVQSESNPASSPQRLIAATDQSPWTVPLPTSAPCYYQVDFSLRSAPPGQQATTRTIVVAHVGQTPACSSGATTTVATTAPPTTTSTTLQPTTTLEAPTTTTGLTPPTVARRTSSGSGAPFVASSTSSTTAAAAGTGSGSPTVASPAAPARSSSGSLAFTGFAVLMAVFVAAVLITAGVGIVRISRTWRSVPAETDSPFDPPTP